MTCIANKINEQNNRVVKTSCITKDKYPECEDYVKALNQKLKYPYKWVIVRIN